MAISDTIKKGMIRAPHRSLLRATGVIQIRSGFRQAVHRGLQLVRADHSRATPIWTWSAGRSARPSATAGGVPFEFNTIGVDDGIAMGHVRDEVLASPAAS